METLPSSEDILRLAAGDDVGDHSKCRELILRAVNYGSTPHESLEERRSSACQLLTDVLKKQESMEDTLVDALWLQSCVRPLPSPDSTESPECKNPLAQLVQALVESIRGASFVAKLQSNLLPSMVGKSDLSSEQDLLKRLKVYNTQVFYKQQKYNLLQEETEGFSKVVSFLSSSKTMDDKNHRQQLFQLMGTFELDPHRVMDLALDVLAAKLFPQGVSDHHRFSSCQKPQKTPHVQWLLELLPLFSIDALPSLVAFKLTLPGGPSEELKRTIAFLVVESFLDFDVVLNKYAFSVVKDIEEAHKVLYLRDKRRIQALTKVSLSGTTKEDPKLAELTEQLQKLILPLKQQPLLSILYTLMQWQDWNDVKKLLPRDCWGYLADLIPQTFGFSLCDIAQDRLKPLYQKRVNTPGLLKVWQVDKMQVDTEEVSLNEMIERLADPLLCTFTSSCISARPILFVQLCRLLKESFPQEIVELWRGDPTYDFLSNFILPSMCLYASNPAISTEVWGVLERLPYATRYRLYEDWKGEGLERWGLSLTRGSGKPLFLSEMELKAGKAARYALKRLSKDNIRDMSRQLAKVTNCCPLVVYSTILNQMESYDNMVEVMVDAQRFTNPLGLDVLSFCILSRLSGTSGGVNRSLLKEDGVNVSQWLQSLEAFVGAFHKRHPFVEFRGILAYLMRQLRDGHVLELGMIRTLLKVPGGYTFSDYSPVASLSAVQIQGRAGSASLNREIMSFGIAEDVNVVAAKRIREVLQSDGVGVSMLILIAHARSRTLFETSKKGEMPVKLVANLFDTCQVVLSILLDFLTTDRTETETDQDEGQVSSVIEQYALEIPTFQQLYEDYGLGAETAWKLCRPLVRHIRKMSDTDLPEVLKRFQLSTGFRDVYKLIVPESSSFKHALFECFFVNSLHDIFCPDSVYVSEHGRVAKEIERLERSAAGSQGGKAEQDSLVRLKKLSESLKSEQESHQSHVEHTLKELEEKKSTLFDSENVTPEAAQALLTNCVYPRSLQSPDDAMYCSHFVFKLHDIGTPGFSTLHYIDELISAVSGSLFGLTENEAANVAVLLWQTWSVVNSWRYEEGLYDSAVAGKPGAFMSFQESETGEAAETQEVEHKDFVMLYNRWHATLGSALTGCLQSSDYMHLRTGLLILTRVVDVFPTRPKLGNKLFKILLPLQDEDSDRPDIRAAATAYGTMLLKARDDGKWIEEDASVAKARAEKEKAVAEERKKALEKRFDEMEQDSKKITEEIGPRDRFERRRDGNEPNGNGQQHEKGQASQPRESRENGEVPNRDRGAPSRDNNRERSRDSGRTDEKWPRNLSLGAREEGEDRRHREGMRDDDRRQNYDREREDDRRRREERSHSRERERRRDGDRGRDDDRRRHDRRSDNWERESERRGDNQVQRSDDRSHRNRRSNSRDRGGPRDSDRDRSDSRRRPERRSLPSENDIENGEEKVDNRGPRNQGTKGKSRGRQAKDGGQIGANDEGRGGDSRGLEKRWVQSDSAAAPPEPGKGSRSLKRGRNESPSRDDGRGAGKRARVEPATQDESKPVESGRAPSPPRRTRSGAESGGGNRNNRSGRSRRRR